MGRGSNVNREGKGAVVGTVEGGWGSGWTICLMMPVMWVVQRAAMGLLVTNVSDH